MALQKTRFRRGDARRRLHEPDRRQRLIWVVFAAGAGLSVATLFLARWLIQAPTTP